MRDLATEKWEFSLLVDRANRILEIRGLSELYLGTRANQLMGRHLVSFFDESERLGFLRYMARLLVRGEAEPVSATLRTTSIGIKRFAMAAKKGDGRNNWWILFSQETQAAGARPRMANGDQPFATEDEFAVLVDAREPGRAPLDITVFRARALSEGTAPLTEAQQVALDEKLGESLAGYAHEGIVARPAAGEYAMLHGEDRPMEEIERKLVKVAAEHNLPDLELVRETRSLDGTTSAAQVIGEMRRKLQQSIPDVAPSAAPQAAKRRIWIPVAAVGVVVVIAVAWIALR